MKTAVPLAVSKAGGAELDSQPGQVNVRVWVYLWIFIPDIESVLMGNQECESVFLFLHIRSIIRLTEIRQRVSDTQYLDIPRMRTKCFGYTIIVQTSNIWNSRPASLLTYRYNELSLSHEDISFCYTHDHQAKIVVTQTKFIKLRHFPVGVSKDEINESSYNYNTPVLLHLLLCC